MYKGECFKFAKIFDLRVTTILFILLGFGLNAQEDSLVLLTKNFKFGDGIFLTFDDFKENRANLSWDTVYAKLHTNPQKFITMVDSIQLESKLINDEIWGFSLGGIPYVNLNKKSDAGLDIFAGLKVRGNICYFSLLEIEEESQIIKAYNPRTGVPFREGEIITKKEVEKRFMLSFENGEIKPFGVENFLSWIENDPRLVNTVMGIEVGELSEKLFKCLLIYDDRNPVFIPLRE